MNGTSVNAWVPLAAVAAGIVAAAVATRGIAAVVHVAVDEVSYRAGMGELGDLVRRLG